MSNPTPMEQLKISQEFYLRKYLELTPQEQQLYPQFPTGNESNPVGGGSTLTTERISSQTTKATKSVASVARMEYGTNIRQNNRP